MSEPTIKSGKATLEAMMRQPTIKLGRPTMEAMMERGKTALANSIVNIYSPAVYNLTAERGQLREKVKLLQEDIDTLWEAIMEEELGKGTDKLVEQLRERVKLLEADLGDACEENGRIVDSSLKQIGELKTQLTKAREALREIAHPKNWFHAIEDDIEYTAWRGEGEPDDIAYNVLTEMEGKQGG